MYSHWSDGRQELLPSARLWGNIELGFHSRYECGPTHAMHAFPPSITERQRFSFIGCVCVHRFHRRAILDTGSSRARWQQGDVTPTTYAMACYAEHVGSPDSRTAFNRFCIRMRLPLPMNPHRALHIHTVVCYEITVVPCAFVILDIAEWIIKRSRAFRLRPHSRCGAFNNNSRLRARLFLSIIVRRYLFGSTTTTEKRRTGRMPKYEKWKSAFQLGKTEQ